MSNRPQALAAARRRPAPDPAGGAVAGVENTAAASAVSVGPTPNTVSVPARQEYSHSASVGRRRTQARLLLLRQRRQRPAEADGLVPRDALDRQVRPAAGAGVEARRVGPQHALVLLLRHGAGAEVERRRDRRLAARPLVVAPARFVVRRAHAEDARGDQHQLHADRVDQQLRPLRRLPLQCVEQVQLRRPNTAPRAAPPPGGSGRSRQVGGHDRSSELLVPSSGGEGGIR